MVQHMHAIGIMVLDHQDQKAAGSQPRGQSFKSPHPFRCVDVVEHVRTKNQVAGRSDLGVQNLFRDKVRPRTGALQVVPQRRVGLDRDGPAKAFGEPCSHLSVAGAGVNKDGPGRQVIDQVAQPLLRLELLIGVIEKDLKGLVIFTTLRIVHGDRLCPSHSVLHRVYVRTLLSRLGGATPCAYAGPRRPGALERLAARTTLTVRPLERVDDCVLIRVLDLRLVAEKLAVRYPSGIAFVVTSRCSAYGEGLGAREGGSSGTARGGRAESPACRVEGSADSGSDCMRLRLRPWWRRRGWRRVSARATWRRTRARRSRDRAWRGRSTPCRPTDQARAPC